MTDRCDVAPHVISFFRAPCMPWRDSYQTGDFIVAAVKHRDTNRPSP